MAFTLEGDRQSKGVQPADVAPDEQPQEPQALPSAQVQDPVKPTSAPAVAPQEPVAPAQPSAFGGAEPPADFEERMMRLIKLRADALQEALVDDRGRVLREPLTEDAALRATISYLPKYLATEYGPQAMRDYINGGRLPNGWEPSKGTVKSRETQELDWRAEVARRDMNPAWLAARDYVIDPLTQVGIGATQVGVNMAVGAMNLLPGDTQKPIDVEATIKGTTRDELDAIARARSTGAKVVSGTGNLVGTGFGLSLGAVGKVLGVGGSAGGALGKRLLGSVGEAVGHSAGAFGAYGWLTAQPGERTEGLIEGSIAGALQGAAQKVASYAIRSMYNSSLNLLGKEETAAMKSLKEWAVGKQVLREAGESATGYEKRLVDTWISAGAPGMPSMPVKKVISYALRGGADAIGFSAIDQVFRKDFIDAAFNNKPELWDDVLTKFGANFVGSTILAVPLKSIVPWQRRADVQKTGKPPSEAEQLTARGPDALQQQIDTREVELGVLRDAIQNRYEEANAIKAKYRRLGWRIDQPDALYFRSTDSGLEARGETSTVPMEPTGGSSVGDLLLKNTDWLTPVAEKPKTIDFHKDDTRREWWGAQAKEFQGTVTIEVSGNAAEEALRFVSRNSEAGRQLQAAVNTPGAKVTFTADEARKLVDYHMRMAPRKRANADDPAIAQSKVQAVDSIAEKLVKAFGKPVKPPRGDKRTADIKSPPEKPAGVPVSGPESRNAAPRQVEGPEVVDKPYVVDIHGTDFDITIRGNTAEPSAKLADHLGIPHEQLPADLLTELIERVGLQSALRSKYMLPGTEVSVEGVKATPSQGDKEALLRRVVMGVVQESPLGVEQKWTEAKEVPQRGKDAITPEQQMAVEQLRALSEQREGVDPSDASLLRDSINVLDTVSAESDRSVAETMQALPKIVEALAKQEPGAEKALAESLTTKTPDKAIADAKAQNLAAARSRVEKAKQALEEIGPEPIKPTEESFFGPEGRQNAEPEEIALFKERVQNHKDWVKEQKKLAKDLAAAEKELGFQEAPQGVRTDLGPGQSGHLAAVGPKEAAQAVERLWEKFQEGAGVAGSVMRRVWNGFQRSQIDRVEDLGLHQEAEIGRNGTTRTKAFQAEIDVAGLMDLRRMPRAQVDSMGDRVSDGIGGYASVHYRANDAGAARHFGEVVLTPEQAEVANKVRAVVYTSGQIAERLGIVQTDADGSNPRPFKADANRRVMPRQYTLDVQQARLKQSGPVYDALMGWFLRKYGWTPEEAARQFSDARSLTALDATEVRRSIDVVPEFIDVPGRGVVRVLEGRPLEFAEKLAFRSSQVLGALSVMPRGPEQRPANAPTYQTPQGLEPLPPSGQALVDSVKGRDRQEAVARMVRSMHGLPVDAAPRIFTPGEPGYHAVKFFDSLFGLAKAAALSISFPKNLAEPLSNAAHFGTRAIATGYKEVMTALAEGRFADLHREAVADGFVTDTKLNDPWWGKETTLENVENVLKKSGEVLTTLMRGSQDINELVNYKAAKERLAEMREGRGTREDANALSLLGFKPEQIEPMLKGRGTPEQYERYQRNIVGNLAGGRSLRSAERSDVAHSKSFNSLVWFTNFFQTRARVADRLSRDVSYGATKEEKAARFGRVLQLAAVTAASGALGNIAQKYLLGNSEEVENYLREEMSGSALDITGNLGQLVVSGIVGGLGQPVADAISALGEPGDTRDAMARSFMRVVGPLETTYKFADYLAAVVWNSDKPGYENKDLLGKTAQYVRNMLPAAKAIHEGLFGMAALAVSEKNVELDNAQDSMNRWLRENKPEEFKTRRRPEETREARDSIRRVMDLVAADRTWSDEDLVSAVIDAEAARLAVIENDLAEEAKQGKPRYQSISMSYKEARNRVAASILKHRMLPEPGKYSTEEVESLYRHLGDKNVQKLRDFDTVLELLAKRVRGVYLHGAARERMQPRN